MRTIKIELNLKVKDRADEAVLLRLVKVIRALALSAFSIEVEHPAIIHLDDGAEQGC